MTATTKASSFDYEKWAAERQEWKLKCEEVTAENKEALFAILRTIGISTVTVEYDGYADSGQIENIHARVGDKNPDLHDLAVEFLTLSTTTTDTTPVTMSAHQAIESMVYSLLELTSPGWENNAGASGTFTFNVEEDCIDLAHHERIETTELSTYEF